MFLDGTCPNLSNSKNTDSYDGDGPLPPTNLQGFGTCASIREIKHGGLVTDSKGLFNASDNQNNGSKKQGKGC